MIASVARLLSTSLTIQEAARHVFEQSRADETAAPMTSGDEGEVFLRVAP